MMKELPILFSAPMVRAILDGRKAMTRRVIRQQPSAGVRWGFDGWEDGHGRALRCPYGQPGDRLWVRETWGVADWTEDGYPFIKYAATPGRMHLRENIPDEWSDKVSWVWAELSNPKNYNIDGSAADRRWRPSIFMPRWASRITLELTAVRVERVQDISDEDAEREGVDTTNSSISGYCRERFRKLWDFINAKRGYGWDANPWVWVVEFKRVKP